MSDQFTTPFGDFNLKRIPDNDKNLFAWNSADRYLLNHFLIRHLVEQLIQNYQRYFFLADYNPYSVKTAFQIFGI